MTSTRSLAVLAIVATLGLLTLYLVSPGCFGCGGLVFDGAPPAGLEHDVEATVEAAVVWFTMLASLAAAVLVGGDIIVGRRSA